MLQKNKTILDILLEKNRLDQNQAAVFSKELNNTQIEKKLRQENIVSSEDIAKAYAILYDLPFIRLENYNVSKDAFDLIPLDLVRKYKVITFEKKGNIPGGKVKIALGYPAELKSNPPELLEKLQKEKNVNIDLYITTPEDIDGVTRKMESGSDAPKIEETKKQINYSKTGDLKTIDLKNIKIPYDVITKFPAEVSKKYKIVVFENPSPNLIKVAVSDPYDTKVQEILDFVREKNNISIQEYVAPSKDINEAIEMYYRKPLEEKKQPKEKKDVEKEEKKEIPEVKLSPKKIVNKIVDPRKYKEEETPTVKPEFVPKSEGEEEEQDKNLISIAAPETDLDKFLGQEVKDVETLKKITETGNVPEILAATVALAVLKKASDIHIEPLESDLRIRFRVDGILRDIIKMPLELQPALISRVKILSKLKIDEQRIPQDGRFDVKTHGHEIDLRISTLPTVRGEKTAMRILDKTKSLYSLEELGLEGRNLKVLEENITQPYGVILATGPTGSGKSTTLYSILQKISSPQVNVITLEDPVEYEIPGINQCQVKPKIGFSFAEGLRSVLRQDPNIIMVGEIRDAETASLATHAALTGHLVLSTLHTNDSSGALPRLINMGIEPFLITSSINCIIGQRLVRKVCPKCKKKARIPEKLHEEITRELRRFSLQKPYQFYEGTGCSECNHGYSGRIGIYEILAMSEKIEEVAIKRKPASEILATAITEGMITMKQDGLLKALKGVTTVSEVFRVTSTENK